MKSLADGMARFVQFLLPLVFGSWMVGMTTLSPFLHVSSRDAVGYFLRLLLLLPYFFYSCSCVPLPEGEY